MKRPSALQFTKALAFLHRWGWVIAVILVLEMTDSVRWLGACCILYSTWTAIGYAFKWKHIYCSFQNANHEQMTPDRIQWSNVRKSDVYVISAFFFLAGCLLISFE